MKTLLVVFAAIQLLLGVLLWVTPGFFHEQIGPYGPRNDHYMGDLATWSLALGAVTLVAVRRVEWRLPVLVLALVQNVLHSFNHLLDVGEADPGYLGPVNLVSLVLLCVLLGWMVHSQRELAR